MIITDNLIYGSNPFTDDKTRNQVGPKRTQNFLHNFPEIAHAQCIR